MRESFHWRENQTSVCGMHGIDQTRTFVPLQLAILTVSDTRTQATDGSGDELARLASSAGHLIVARTILPDNRIGLAHQLREWVQNTAIDVVLLTGGTGVTGRDVTPEAVRDVIDKEIPGFGELFRMLSYESIGTSTIQSRALGGVAGSTYIFAMPGSTSACREAWAKILHFQLDIRHRPCNFAELIPRLAER